MTNITDINNLSILHDYYYMHPTQCQIKTKKKKRFNHFGAKYASIQRVAKLIKILKAILLFNLKSNIIKSIINFDL